MPHPEDEPRQIDLREFFAVLRRRKWSVIPVTLLVIGSALSVMYLRTPQYTSSARVEVLPKTAQDTLVPAYTLTNMDTESARVTSTQIEGRAAALLVAGGQAASLATDADVSVSVPANTTDLDITCTTGQASTAQACAQAYADAYVADRKALVDQAAADLRKPLENTIVTATSKITALGDQIAGTKDSRLLAKLERQQTALQQILTTAQLTLYGLPTASHQPAQIATPAELPTEPSNKNYVTTGVLAGILGLALGIGLAFVRQRMDASVGEHEGLDEALGTPVLAVVPHVGGRRKSGGSTVVSLVDPDGRAAEAYRSARPMLLHRAREHDVKTVLVTGPGQGEGKSTTTANLGVALARSGYRVALLSCDLRKPALHRLFGMASEPGLTDVLQGRVPLHRALAKTGVPNLLLLPSGVPPKNPSELLASGAMAALIVEMRAHADFVLLDTPPSLVVADALELVPFIDGILVVVDGSKTVQADVLRLRGQVDQVGGRLIGCVLNNLDPKAASRYGSYYSAAYRYAGHGRRSEDRERGEGEHLRSFPRGAHEVNVSLGPVPIEGSDRNPNGNGKPYVPEEPVSVPEAVSESEPVSVPEAVSEPAGQPVPQPERPSDKNMWR